MRPECGPFQEFSPHADQVRNCGPLWKHCMLISTQLQLLLSEYKAPHQFTNIFLSKAIWQTSHWTIYRLVLNMETEMSLSLFPPSSSCSSSSSLVSCRRSALPAMLPPLALPLPGRPPRLALALRRRSGRRWTKVGMQKTPVGCHKVEVNLLNMDSLAALGGEN